MLTDFPGEVQGEGAALARPGADLHIAALPFGDLTHQIQPDTPAQRPVVLQQQNLPHTMHLPFCFIIAYTKKKVDDGIP